MAYKFLTHPPASGGGGPQLEPGERELNGTIANRLNEASAEGFRVAHMATADDGRLVFLLENNDADAGPVFAH